jgi:hypothetical protein
MVMEFVEGGELFTLLRQVKVSARKVFISPRVALPSRLSVSSIYETGANNRTTL